MWHIGMDLHRKALVMAMVGDDGEVLDPVTIECRDTAAIEVHANSLYSCLIAILRSSLPTGSSLRWTSESIVRSSESI